MASEEPWSILENANFIMKGIIMYYVFPHRIGNEHPEIMGKLELDIYFSTTLEETIKEAIYLALNVEEGEEDHTLVSLWVNSIVDSMYRMLEVFGEIEFNYTRATICRMSSDDSEAYVRITKEADVTNNS